MPSPKELLERFYQAEALKKQNPAMKTPDARAQVNADIKANQQKMAELGGGPVSRQNRQARSRFEINQTPKYEEGALGSLSEEFDTPFAQDSEASDRAYHDRKAALARGYDERIRLTRENLLHASQHPVGNEIVGGTHWTDPVNQFPPQIPDLERMHPLDIEIPGKSIRRLAGPMGKLPALGNVPMPTAIVGAIQEQNLPFMQRLQNFLLRNSGIDPNSDPNML